jgi:Protein of unknown function (DUF3501)
MRKLTVEDLFTLERYARERPAMRERVLLHKKRRQLPVGPNMTWLFEDRLTIQYQVQEMLRIERIFEPEAIAEELGSYNPLIPDGSNLKATLLVEFPEEAVRRVRLTQLRGVEDRCYLQVAGLPAVHAIADEDLERENDEKTSAVHFLRFEFTADMIARLRSGATLAAGVDHASYTHRIDALPPETLNALLADLE